MEQEILEYLNGKGWLSTTEIATALSEDKTQIRLTLKNLVENGKISKRGKKRGTKYGILGGESVGDISQFENDQSEARETLLGKFNTVFDFVEAAIKMIAPGEMYSVMELAREICSFAPSSKFTEWDVVQALPRCAKKGIVMAHMARTPEGSRAVYRRP